ncbi:MAG: glycosyltransferase family 2 protein [Planctomycetota bacterium]
MPPELTVIVTTYNARGLVEGALRSLLSQQARDRMEIILVDSSSDGTAVYVEENHPSVHLIRSDRRLYCGDARNAGIRASSAPIIAFFDADCEADPDWAARVLEAHAAYPGGVIGGAVENANPASGSGWAYYLTEFARWAPGRPAGEVDDVPGCAMTIKRAAYDRFGPFIAGTYCSDSAFHWRMAAEDERPRFDPTIRVRHRNPTELRGIVSHTFMHGRQFGRVRTDHRGARVWKRFGWALASPLIALLLHMRTWRHAAQAGLLGQMLRAAPAVLAAQAAWSAGEAVSYARSLFGGPSGFAPARGAPVAEAET